MSDSWEIGISICTRLYIKQVTNKNLPRSTGYSTQRSLPAYTKRIFKADVCTCTTDSLCCKAETNNNIVVQLYSNKVFKTSSIFPLFKIQKEQEGILDPFSLSPSPEACYVTSFLLDGSKDTTLHTHQPMQNTPLRFHLLHRRQHVCTLCLLRGQV